jgi:hypothetical protein
MGLVRSGQVAERRVLSRRGLVVMLAICALTVSLASRVSHATFFKTPVAQSSSSTAKIQHLDQDASQWEAPPATFTLLWVTESFVAFDGDEIVPVFLQDDALHNRPPPLS